MKNLVDVNGTELVLVETNTFDTRVHPCSGCWFHENKIVCDEFIGSHAMGETTLDCGVTKVFKENK